MEIFPNPAVDQLSVKLPVTNSDELTLRINNSLGKLIYQKSIDINDGETIQVDLEGFGAGIYTVNLESAGKIANSKRLVIIEK